MAAINSVAGGDIRIQDGKYSENSARLGGALYVDGIVGLDVRGNISFENNTAFCGGAMYAVIRNLENTRIQILQARFLNNLADEELVSGDDEGLQNLKHKKMNGPSGRYQSWDRDRTQDASLQKQRKYTVACGPGGGGALCLGLAVIPEHAAAEISLTETEFINNTAKNGGTTPIDAIGAMKRLSCL